jgi:AbrB family looped-hinge helix DNA binding protein
MEEPMESAITVKGQATIPKAIREHLRLKPGDRVKFFVHPDGSVVLLPKLPASALRGIIKSRRRRPVSIEEMTEAVAESATGAAPRATRR